MTILSSIQDHWAHFLLLQLGGDVKGLGKDPRCHLQNFSLHKDHMS